MDDTLIALLDRLARFGAEHDTQGVERARKMLNVTPDTGRFLWILVRVSRATRILEVGTSNAYSTIWLADAAQETSGRVTTLENNPDKVALARANLGEAGLAEYVDLREGDAAETLVQLAGPFDFVFLDADRPQYLIYFELVISKLVSGGLLVADNVISHAQELTDFLAQVRSDSRLFSLTVPIGKGEELSFKL
ncbi:MAG: O-methyltransferase [Nitrospiraceae bacterium]